MSDYVTVNVDVDIPMCDIDDADLVAELRDRGYGVIAPGEVHQYGMFSDVGDYMIESVILTAKNNEWSWPRTMNALSNLSQISGFGEAFDTAVREVVYDALGYDTPFYTDFEPSKE